MGQNGVAKRKNRIVEEMARIMMQVQVKETSIKVFGKKALTPQYTC